MPASPCALSAPAPDAAAGSSACNLGLFPSCSSPVERGNDEAKTIRNYETYHNSPHDKISVNCSQATIVTRDAHLLQIVAPLLSLLSFRLHFREALLQAFVIFLYAGHPRCDWEQITVKPLIVFTTSKTFSKKLQNFHDVGYECR